MKDYVAGRLDEGAKLVVDGRGFSARPRARLFPGRLPVRPCHADMSIYKDEIFGPVLAVVRAPITRRRLDLANDHQYGNGAAIFTRDGDAARDFASRVQVGMVGINVPIPVPLAYHSFGGWKQSLFGDLHIYGPDGVRFYTKQNHHRTLAQRHPRRRRVRLPDDEITRAAAVWRRGMAAT